MKSGIYRITCLATGMSYIGQSIDIDRRINEHKNHLTHNTHNNIYLQSDYNIYGPNSFVFEPIWPIMEFALDYAESKAIHDFNTLYPNGYNLQTGGTQNFSNADIVKEEMSKSRMGHYVSEETKQKISAANSGENHPMYGKHHSSETIQKMKISHSGENSANARPVISSTGERFISVSDAARWSGSDQSTIHKCCKGKRNHCGKHPITGELLGWSYL